MYMYKQGSIHSPSCGQVGRSERQKCYVTDRQTDQLTRQVLESRVRDWKSPLRIFHVKMCLSGTHLHKRGCTSVCLSLCPLLVRPSCLRKNRVSWLFLAMVSSHTKTNDHPTQMINQPMFREPPLPNRFIHLCKCGGHGVWMGVGCPCPPIRNNVVTPRHLFRPTSAMLGELGRDQKWLKWPKCMNIFFLPGSRLALLTA